MFVMLSGDPEPQRRGERSISTARGRDPSLGRDQSPALLEHINAAIDDNNLPSNITVSYTHLDQALALACDLAAKQALPGVVCVTGSLFVAAAAREALGLAEQRDP